MNILHIIPSMDPASGGPCQGIRNIIPELQKLGVHPQVVCLDDPAIITPLNDPFPVTALGPANNPWRYSKKLVPWLIDNLNRFDVVIIHAIWLYHGRGFMKALAQYKKMHSNKSQVVKYPKFYVMPHGMLDPYFQLTPERKIKAIRNWFYWNLIESKLINNANGVLFTCEEEMLLAKKTFHSYRPKREINIGYGVVAPPLYEATMKQAFLEKCPDIKDDRYILFLSRIHEKKGLVHLIEAYDKIVNQKSSLIPAGANFQIPKLVIAGPGLDSEHGIKIQSMVQARQLEKFVFFPGMLAGDAKWGAFYQCDAFILPSHQENFGIAVVEALACKKPVLISNQINIWREIIDAGGGLVEDDTAIGTEKLLANWFKLSDVEKEKMSELALESYNNSFSIVPSAKAFHQMLTS